VSRQGAAHDDQAGHPSEFGCPAPVHHRVRGSHTYMSMAACHLAPDSAHGKGLADPLLSHESMKHVW
jgi:hypothetical protein